MGTLKDKAEHFVFPGADLSQYLLIALLLAGISIKSPGAILYVDASATGTNNGSSWANAFTNLSSALNASLAGDELWIAAGVYQPGTGDDIQASFQVTKPISLYGGFHGNETSLQQRNWTTNATILSGDLGVPEERSDNSVHVVVIQSQVPSRLDGLTIRDGGNPFEGEGAGILDIGFSSTGSRGSWSYYR